MPGLLAFMLTMVLLGAFVHPAFLIPNVIIVIGSLFVS